MTCYTVSVTVNDGIACAGGMAVEVPDHERGQGVACPVEQDVGAQLSCANRDGHVLWADGFRFRHGATGVGALAKQLG